jgi:hypothetical protein
MGNFTGNFDLSTHGDGLASVFAVRMRVSGLEENLVLLTFPENNQSSLKGEWSSRFHPEQKIAGSCNAMMLLGTEYALLL